MSKFSRNDLETRYIVFQKFVLEDQRNYYTYVLRSYTTAGNQLNGLKALFALLAGLSAAFAGFIVQNWFLNGASCTLINTPEECNSLKTAINILTILAVVLPAVAALFNTLSELYQYDSVAPIIEASAENLEIADSLAPHPAMDDKVFEASIKAYGEASLKVMEEESKRWERAVRIKPEQLEKFVAQELEKTKRSYSTSSSNID